MTDTERSKPARGNIQSLERAALLLDAVAAGGEHGASLTDMGEATGLHSSTVFHLVKTLEKLGYLARLDGGKAYFVGPRLFSLAAGALQFQTLSIVGQPVLDALSAETGEASHLAVRLDARVLMVAQADARGMLQISRNLGQVRPIHATAIGKVLLAACVPAERAEIMAAVTFERFTRHTIGDAAALAAETARVLDQGYGEDSAEFDDNIRCIAVVVTAFAARMTVAVGISGPVWRMDDDAVARHLTTLRRHAADLEARLGGSKRRTV